MDILEDFLESTSDLSWVIKKTLKSSNFFKINPIASNNPLIIVNGHLDSGKIFDKEELFEESLFKNLLSQQSRCLEYFKNNRIFSIDQNFNPIQTFFINNIVKNAKQASFNFKFHESMIKMTETESVTTEMDKKQMDSCLKQDSKNLKIQEITRGR